jgi:sarcosine oxidase
MTADRFDVAIVGLGALGSAAAYWAARRGVRAVGLERFELGHGRGASEDHSRIIRRTYPTEDYVAFARAAFEAWAEVEAEGGAPLLLRTGGLDLFPADAVDDPEAYLARARDAGFALERLDAAELRHRWPAWRVPDDLTALFQPDAGIVAASIANATHRRLATARGAELRAHTPVRRVEPSPDGYLLVLDDARVWADALIVTADAWTNQVLADLGLAWPLHVQQEQVTYFEPSDPARFEPDAFPVWIWHDEPHVYGLPSFGAPGPKVAFHGAGGAVDPDDRDPAPDPGYAAGVADFVGRHLPGAGGPVIEVRTCLYTLTPDRHFVLDRIPGHERTAIGLGTGHAFKFASVFGQALVDVAVFGDSPWRAPRFAADRAALAAH